MSPDPDRRAGESGFALVAALLAVVILGGMAVVFVSTVVTESRASGINRDREITLHVAEAAVDELIARVNVDEDWYTTDGNGDGFTLDLAINADEASQRAWALDIIVDQGELDPVRSGSAGEGFAIRPVDPDGVPMDMIFGVGLAPDRDNPRHVRVIKIQYDRMYFQAKQAIFVCGDLDIGGSASVSGAKGSVHANGAVNVIGTDHWIDGRLTAAGAITGSTPQVGIPPAQPFAPEEFCPEISARDFYGRAQPYTCYTGVGCTPIMGKDSKSVLWYDLCPDGTARQAGVSPCTGAIVFEQGKGAANHLGWRHTTTNEGRSRWRVQNIQSGVFYLYRSDAVITGSGDGTVSVLAEKDSADQGKSGNISMTGEADIEPAVDGFLMAADRDLDFAGSASPGGEGVGGQGFLAAGEQARLTGDASIDGSVYVRGDPHTPFSPISKSSLSGDFTVQFDADLNIPLAGVVRITHWNEI